MDTRNFALFVGIDSSERTHEYHALAPDGSSSAQGAVPHSAQGIADLIRLLLPLAQDDPAAIAVAIETNHGPVVETLLVHDFAVFSINPKQLDRFRDRFSPAGCKDDRLDALVLADSLRTDTRLFRAVELRDPETRRLRGLVRLRADLSNGLRRVANRLRDLLVHNAPELLQLWPAADEPLLWDVLDLAKSFSQRGRVQRQSIAALLRKRRIRRLSADGILAALRAPSLVRAPGVDGEVEDRLRFLLPQLRLAHQQLTECDKDIGKALAGAFAVLEEEAEEESPRAASLRRDAEIIGSCKGIGPHTLAALLTEAWRPIRDRDLASLRAIAGVAPVTKRSGQSCGVRMRYACSAPLRHAMHAWALSAINQDPRAREHYDSLRARGHNYNRAVRGVSDRLLSMLIAMLRDDTLYDPLRRQRRVA